MRIVKLHVVLAYGVLRVCSWCGSEYRNGKWVKPEKPDIHKSGTVTHGICPTCYKQAMSEIPRKIYASIKFIKGANKNGK